MFIDTLSNLRKAKPVFKTKSGKPTNYAFHCGHSWEQLTKSGKKRAQLYVEHEHYHVRLLPIEGRFEQWETFNTLTEAWKQFNLFVKSN